MSFLETLACTLAIASRTVFADVAFAASVAPSGYTHAFTTQPAAADWVTVSGTGAGGDTYDMDADVNANITASALRARTTLDPTRPPAANPSAAWHSIGTA